MMGSEELRSEAQARRPKETIRRNIFRFLAREYPLSRLPSHFSDLIGIAGTLLYLS